MDELDTILAEEDATLGEDATMLGEDGALSGEDGGMAGEDGTLVAEDGLGESDWEYHDELDPAGEIDAFGELPAPSVPRINTTGAGTIPVGPLSALPFCRTLFRVALDILYSVGTLRTLVREQHHYANYIRSIRPLVASVVRTIIQRLRSGVYQRAGCRRTDFIKFLQYVQRTMPPAWWPPFVRSLRPALVQAIRVAIHNAR